MLRFIIKIFFYSNKIKDICIKYLALGLSKLIKLRKLILWLNYFKVNFIIYLEIISEILELYILVMDYLN